MGTPTLIPPASAVPVFFDPSGRRWQRILTGLFLLVVLTTTLVVKLVPAVFAPVWGARQNQASDYPRQLLASAGGKELPVLGTESGFAFSRVDLVKRIGGRAFLTDPFSGDIFREATPDEIASIGNSRLVEEQYGRPADHQLIITFDDGPDPRNTPQILDLLSKEHVPATFFVIGDNVVKNPDLLTREIREGHMVGNHSLTHPNFDGHGDMRNREELVGTDHILRADGNYASRLFRIPTGDPDTNTLALVTSQQLGYLHVDYDVDTRDWSYKPGQPIPLPKLDGQGHVVLMHDGGGDRSTTVKLLGQLIQEAKHQGYTFATIGSMLPTEYVPKRGITASLADNLTYDSLVAVNVVPNRVMEWLFWFGAISLTVMSSLYVLLALINKRYQSRKKWYPMDPRYMPLVSVILPVFNEEKVVRKTLDALKASDYPAVEVIAVNDGSRDDTLAILQEFALGWSQLRVLSQENAGKAAAANNGIANAQGEVIIALDGDTIFEPQTVRMLARHFYGRRGRNLGAVAGHVKVGNRRNILTAWQSLEYISGICVTRMAEGLLGAISIVPGACAAWRTEAILQAGGYSHDTLAEDADLTLTVQRLGYRIIQENYAIAWTEAPMTVKEFARQRLRWMYGTLQALRKHIGMVLRPRYGWLGMFTLPYALLSFLVPLLFMPLALIAAVVSVTSGNWRSLALFAAFVTGVHLIISIVAIAMVRESPWHLLVVFIYRPIYEVLRFYLIYVSLMRIMRGRMVGFYRPERTGSVMLPAPTAS